MDLFDNTQYMVLKGYSRAHLKEITLECQNMDKVGLTDFMVDKLKVDEILVRSCRRIMKRKILL